MNKHISIELAKSIHKVAEEKGVELPVGQKNEMPITYYEGYRKYMNPNLNPYRAVKLGYAGMQIIPLYNYEELLELIPLNILLAVCKTNFIGRDKRDKNNNSFNIKFEKMNDYYQFSYELGNSDDGIKYKTEKVSVEALGKVTLYLLENDLFPKQK